MHFGNGSNHYDILESLVARYAVVSSPDLHNDLKNITKVLGSGLERKTVRYANHTVSD